MNFGHYPRICLLAVLLNHKVIDMTNSSAQLVNQHEEIIAAFANSPYITVSSLGDEDPPQKYEVEYKVKGAQRQEDGGVDFCEQHRVTVAIPFGYPNFPPSCKPVSSIFHPDIDPAAICISDFWNESRSLTELIIHLGLMISGQKFSIENSFNPDAAKWYNENEDKLPFDSVDFNQTEAIELNLGPDNGVGEELQLEEEEEESAGAQPTFDLGLEDISGDEEITLDLDGVDEVDAGVLHETTVSDTPDPLDTLDLPDMPDATDIADTPDAPTAPVTPTVPTPPDAPPEFLPGELPKPGQQNSEKSKQAGGEAGPKSKKIVALVCAFLVVALIGVAGYFMVMDIKNYDDAEVAWQDADHLLAGNQYKAVEKKGKTALAKLAAIRFIKKQEREILTKKINDILRSPEFKGGLAGKLLFEGQYLSIETIKVIESVREMISKGDGAVMIEKWHKALIFYEEAQELVKGNTQIQKSLVDKVNLAVAIANMNILVQEGSLFLANSELENAVISFQKAAEIANSSAGISTEKIVSIHKSLDKALLQKFIQDGEGAFSAIDLSKALKNFNHALLLAEKESATDSTYAENIRRSIRQVKLYQMLEKGKVAFESSSWNSALASFEDALSYLLTSRVHNSEMVANERGIKKKIDQIKVNQKKTMSAQSRVNKQLKESLRLEQDIVKIIERSQFKDDPSFIEIKKESKKEIKSLKSRIDIDDKTAYLKENYQNIFRSNHSLAGSANLKYPQISFVKKTGNVQLFNLKCTGRTTTGKISLELNYQYDLGRKKWGLAEGKKN